MTSGSARAAFKLAAWMAALAGAGFLLAFFGPDLALRLYLSQVLPRQTGLNVAYVSAAADLRNRDLFLRGLTLTGADLGRLTFDLELRGFQNLFWSRPGLNLGDRMALHGVSWERESWTLSAPRITAVSPRWPADEEDLPFSLLIAHDPRGQGLPDAPGFRVKSLVLSNHDLALEDLDFHFTTPAGTWTGEVKSLKLDDFKSALDRWVRSGGPGLWPELFHLRMDSGRLDLGGQPALLVKTALPEPRRLFTKFSSDSVSYSYFLDLRFDPALLRSFWADPTGLIDRPQDLELALDLTFDPQGRAFQLRSLNLDAPNLGRLDLAAELSGLGPESGLLSALYPARLHGFSLAFQDQGLMALGYARLAEDRGWDEAEVPARLKAELLAPLVEALAENGRLAGLTALAAEAEAFLDQPENLILSVEPARPFPLASLVKKDRYDIINEIGLTLTVNDRPAASGRAPHVQDPSPAPGRTPAE